ncbi:hypothetical protein EDB84DRAFT_1596053 [Lactarius hengduanensis]|nr:hypothetical protein EDB84DRAFT_1596053 [Lactarius hengduanensis]
MSTTGSYYTVAAAIYPYCPPYTFVIVVTAIAIAIAIVVVVVAIAIAVAIVVVVVAIIVVVAVAVAISVAALHCWGSMRGSAHSSRCTPMSVTALVRRPEAVERVSALGPHVCVVEGSFTDAHGLELVERHTRAADDVVNAACSDDLALHSAILAGQRKRMPGKLCENNCWRISGIVAWVNQYSSILGL